MNVRIQSMASNYIQFSQTNRPVIPVNQDKKIFIPPARMPGDYLLPHWINCFQQWLAHIRNK
jgi:hypothetical protein